MLKPMLPNYRNVFIFTTGGEYYGSRIPGLWVFNSTAVAFRADGNSVPNTVAYNFPMELEAGTRFHVRIEQAPIVSSASYMIKCYVDHQLVHKVSNAAAEEFANVKVYVNDLYHSGSEDSFIIYGFKYGKLTYD